MSERFLKLIPSEEAQYLAKKHPNAFILLFFIAERARRENGHPDGLTIGQCHIGDYLSYGLSEKEYRTAKKILIERNHIKIIETCRTRKSEKNSKSTLNLQNLENWADKRATRTTTVGTLAEICSLTVYDINSDINNCQKGDRKGDRGATEGRPRGDEQEGIRSISTYVAIQEEEAQTAAQLRSKDDLTFDFQSWEFRGMAEKDWAQWKFLYPHIDVNIETMKAAQWLKSNPSKSNKKHWRKFLTGWFQRSNDAIENKKAFQAARGNSGPDRRTKDMHGNPTANQHEGKF
jgi:hypothetical protein